MDNPKHHAQLQRLTGKENMGESSTNMSNFTESSNMGGNAFASHADSSTADATDDFQPVIPPDPTGIEVVIQIAEVTRQSTRPRKQPSWMTDLSVIQLLNLLFILSHNP
uniref:Uncharacterized protein n=1 Tax=Solanum tuberosum TaxID=4113 RepID=M1DBX1_SOLTU